MVKIRISFQIALLVTGCGAASLSATPTVGTATATPAVIVVNQPTTVTVTSLITDPSLITTSVNLVRLNPTGSPTILGQLHDDGLNGDAVAGDQIYTIQVAFNQSAGGQIRLQVSAAFKGMLLRVLSNIMTVTVAGQPTITPVVTPPANPAGWNNSSVTVSFNCSDPVSGISSCSSPATVSSEVRAQTVVGTATNTAGITANAAASVSLDETPPTLAIQAPAPGATLFATQTTVSGTAGDLLSGLSAVTCNGIPASLSDGSFTCNLTLNTGSNTVSVRATDVAGNVASATIPLTVLPAPVVTFTSPANLSFLNTTPITVLGTVTDPNATVTVNGIKAPVAGGNFSVTVPLNEGSNTLTAVAQNTAGNVGTASMTITLDTTPPHLTIDSPVANATVTDSAITVTGTVNDIVVGTVNSQDAQVTVNGVAAQVANRTYAAVNVPVNLGANTIQAVARDRVGNAATTNVTVTRISPTQPPAPAIGQAVVTESLTVLSGNNQTGAIGTALSAPLIVGLRDSSGNAVANQAVVFKVTGNNGTVNGAPAVAVNTDATGQAQVSWTLGTRSGAGINTVQASAALAAAPASFTATALTGSPALVVVDSGDDQYGVAGQQLPFPLVAVVTDAGNNRVPNVPVTFNVIAGGGNLNGTQSLIVNSDSDGRALALLTLGPQAGNGNNVVEVSFPGYTGTVPAFSASAKIPGNPASTTISGTVLDNSGNPIQGATMRLFLRNQGNLNNLPQQIGTPVITDAQGQFTMPLAASGFFKLMADGSTAVGNASYPTLEYDIVPVTGQDNTVGTPIYLPALDTVSKLCVDETHGGTLTLPQSPGFSLTVLAGSATFPGGARQGCISVTPVHSDKMPMPPGFGQQPRFLVTIQPVGTTFNPPAAMTLPNADGLPPKSVTEMYSYDHDLSMFVAIGTATVSDDGSVIVSNPGGGVLKAGWHCGGNPNKTATVATCAPCMIAQGNKCIVDPKYSGPNPPKTACADSKNNYNVNIGSGKISVLIKSSCFGACTATGCNPSGLGSSVSSIAHSIDIALKRIFDDDPSTACIGSNLRTQMQNAALAMFGQHKALIVGCEDNPVDSNGVNSSSCAYFDPDLPLGTQIVLRPEAFTNPDCLSSDAVVFHELIHILANDRGAPNHNSITQASDIDPTDKEYGCEAACFGAPFGNKAACQ